MYYRKTIPLPFRQEPPNILENGLIATLAQLVEHSPCKRTVVSSNLTGGSIACPKPLRLNQPNEFPSVLFLGLLSAGFSVWAKIIDHPIIILQ